MKVISAAFVGASVFLSPFQSQAKEALEEVVVVASRTPLTLRQVTSSVSILDAEDIEMQAQPSLLELLRTQTSVGATNTGGAGKASSLRIRGEEGFSTLVLIDGMEVSDPSAVQVLSQVEHIVGTHFERIEILRGPQAFIYGADAGGVISIQTERLQQKGISTSFHAEGGSFESHQVGVSVAAANESLNGFISIDDSRTKGFNARVDDTTEDKDGYDATTIHTRAGWENEVWRVQAVARDVNTSSEYDDCFGLNDCQGKYDQTMGRISAKYKGDSITHQMGISQSSIERELGSVSFDPFIANSVLEKVDYLASIRLKPGMQLALGSDFRHEERNDNFSEKEQRDQLGLFGEWQANFDESVYITGGLRYDDNQDFGEHISGRIGAAYVVDVENATLKYRASYGTGFRAPSMSEIQTNTDPFASEEASNTILKEETSEGAEIGMGMYFVNDSQIELVLFYQEVIDAIIFDSSIGGYLQESGKSRSHGIEISSEVTIYESLTLRAGVMYNDTQTDGGLRRLRRPLWAGNIDLSSRFFNDRLTAYINYRTSHGQIDTTDGQPSSPRIPLSDYGVFNLSLQFDWSEHINTFIRLDNATDKSYQEPNLFNTAERSAYAGVRIKF